MAKNATCFYCMQDTVVWDGDFTLEEMGYEGDGIINCCHCTNCGAEIEYKVRFDNADNNAR